MSRAVTADHVLFDECIDAFRRERENSHIHFSGISYSYVLTSFEITSEIDLGICNVSPSIRVDFPGAFTSFISKVKNPEWVGTHNPHLFGIALSSILSFITGSPCKSTRDGYLCRRDSLTEQDLHQLALLHPVLTAGPGAHVSKHTFAKQQLLFSEASALIEQLFSIDYKAYKVVMQSIRLIDLSISAKRDDFGLAYLLAISAIEALSQKAIKRDKVKKKHPDEKEWKVKAESDLAFKILLGEYMQARGRNEYLRERFILFILKYAPVDEWENYVEHPMQATADYINEVSSSSSFDHLIEKSWFEKYPKDLSEIEINKILSDAYVHRSCFIHRGEQPPHTDPNPTMHRFFQEYREYNEGDLKEYLLPNYELIINLAKHSLIKWLNR